MVVSSRRGGGGYVCRSAFAAVRGDMFGVTGDPAALFIVARNACLLMAV